MSASVLDQLRQQMLRDLAAAEERLRPLAKVKVSPRDEHRSTVRAAFEDAVQALRSEGWSQNQIINTLGVDIRTYLDWLEGKRQLPGWAIAALPESARVVFLKQALSWPEAKTGT